jgi:lipopolysaccharide transport system ATP-binding protein
MAAAIAVDHVSKAYRLGLIGGRTLQEDLARWWAKTRGKPDPLLAVEHAHHARQIGEQFWALDDVSFEVEEQEILGIIGPNGAGKSTLLKILSQITSPTSGQITIKGRVASLLEVGTGFHPDLTGRENIFLNGAILGMTKAEIRSKFDEIAMFSECEDFLDTPVKRYSSGMYVRLAFAIAAHLEPEVLLVDEVLAVGDAKFQKKCLGKMGEVSRRGRTVLFVSHNLVAVQSICRRAIHLRDGKLVDQGPATTVVSQYLRTVHPSDGPQEWPGPGEAPGNGALRVKSVRATPADHHSDGLISMKSPIRIETEFWILTPDVRIHITYHLVNEHGIVVLTTGSPAERRYPGVYRASFVVPGNLLNSGVYSLRFLIIQDGNRCTFEHDSLASFLVVDAAERTDAFLGREPGIVQPHLTWEVKALSDAPMRTARVDEIP